MRITTKVTQAQILAELDKEHTVDEIKEYVDYASEKAYSSQAWCELYSKARRAYNQAKQSA